MLKITILDPVNLNQFHEGKIKKLFQDQFHFFIGLKNRERGGMCLIGNNGETVCHGDEGSPAVFDFEDRKYLGGITSTDLPKTHYNQNAVITHPNGTQERPTAKFFCGPRTLNEGEVFPVKYVRARFRFDWFLNDYVDGHRVRRQEVHDCLVNPPE